MTIEQCYEQLHGDYAQVIQRLPSPALVERFIGKFLDDGSFSELTSAMAACQAEPVPAEALPLLEQVRRDYQMTVDAIRAYRAERF